MLLDYRVYDGSTVMSQVLWLDNDFDCYFQHAMCFKPVNYIYVVHGYYRFFPIFNGMLSIDI